MWSVMMSRNCSLHCSDFRLARTPEESRAINDVTGPVLIISASGMATGGRVLHHLRLRLPDPRTTVLLVGYQALGTRGRLPVEVLPFALPLCERRFPELGCKPVLWADGNRPLTTDNGNYILDCQVGPMEEPARLESSLRAIPGVVGTGLFLGMADTVLVGDTKDFRLIEERRRA